jgi:DNA-binding response OmpR family regulator
MTEPGPSAANRNKVVIGVDDMPQHLKLLQHCIAAAGYTFFGATGGAECLKLVARIEPRLILLDVQMPDIDGYETCRRLRAETGLNHVPIAFLTARNSPEDVKSGLAAGGNDFILKPVSIQRLMERVQYWTSRRVAARGVLRSLG